MKKEQLLIARIADKIKKYEKTGEICSTNFLDPSEIIDSENIVRNIINCFYGGYESAERKILLIGSDEIEDAKEYIEVLTIECQKNITHREVLGSIIGLGINREVLGDIIVKENRADIIALKEISKYIIQNLEKVGREKAKVRKNSFENLLQPEEAFKEIKTTVASLRLDAIISGALGLSREVSAGLIQNQKVKLNYKSIENISKQVKVGDKISVRGYGRIELLDVLGETRKDRIRVVLCQKGRT